MQSGTLILDLYGTIVADLPPRRRADRWRLTARDLECDESQYVAAMWELVEPRIVGAFGSSRNALRQVASRCGVVPSDAAVDKAMARLAAFTRADLTPGPLVISALERFRVAGWSLGVLSDCELPTKDAWPHSSLAEYFNAAVFSCTTGLRKPALLQYLRCASALGKAPHECRYAGDGARNELDGAVSAGMAAVRLREPALHPSQTGDSWGGVTVRDLAELADVLL